MLKKIAVSQRIIKDKKTGEVRDCLDVRWTQFLTACGAIAVPIPNFLQDVDSALNALDISGIILSGGNSLSITGDCDVSAERDAQEHALINYAKINDIPLIGVCRGMQMLCHYYGSSLSKVQGHVAVDHAIEVLPEGRGILENRTQTNSYHNYAVLAKNISAPLELLAVSKDDIAEAVSVSQQKMLGIMWHPERVFPFEKSDIHLFSTFFSLS